jgi:hypothetical protein
MANRTDADTEALALAIEMRRQRSSAHRAQVDAKLADESWYDVGRFCAYSCQTHSLNLKPWQFPPIWVASDVEAALSAPPPDTARMRDAALLLQRMQHCGVSIFHPTPIAACEAAERAAAMKSQVSPHAPLA